MCIILFTEIKASHCINKMFDIKNKIELASKRLKIDEFQAIIALQDPGYEIKPMNFGNRTVQLIITVFL